jgi:hypothetical protein
MNLQELKVLKDAMASVNRTRKDFVPLADDVLKHLVERVKEIRRTCPDFNCYVEEPPYVGACGCMGPNAGRKFCNCQETVMFYTHRFDILYQLKLEEYQTLLEK